MIEIKRLSHTYDDDEVTDKKLTLKDVSLTIRDGQFLTILGHNGSGKSTIAKHMNGILLPMSGDVIVNGINTKDQDRLFDIRSTVGMVFQNPDNQIVASLVEEDVAFGPENLGIPPAQIQERVDFALHAVDMEQYRNFTVSNLSGGQKQRVAIAGIIAMMPRIIVLDEPTAMLDPLGRREVMKTIKTLNKKHGITIVLITHFMDEAAQGDRVVVMDHGRVIVDDTPDMTFANVALLKSVGLDVPQTTDLLFRLRGAGMNVHHNHLTVTDCGDEILKAGK